MSILRLHKVIGSLPSQLEPNAIYAVRVGSGFDLYITDNTGNIAHRVNSYAGDADTVDGFHASQTPTANTIPVAGSDGKLARGWLPPGSSFLTLWHILNPVNTNTWYIPYAGNCTALTTLALTANRIYYIPFVPLVNIKATGLAVEVTTASAGTGQIGIYDSINYGPNSLISVVVSIDTGATGVKSGTVNVNLDAGKLYWLGLINSSAATIRAVAVGGIQPILGIATGGTAWNTHYYQAGSGGVLPSTAGALTNGTSTLPAIYMRYSVI